MVKIEKLPDFKGEFFICQQLVEERYIAPFRLIMEITK
ncbi:hypothetical protein CFK62_06540 [Streptococcus agalactiae]|nr:hypothetical protein CUZ18_06385 [Streptococcus agalactiae]KAF1128201.1 hypothetical protein B8U92_00185 [Streptococcus agalactiae]KAF1245285.1 hypothetical protein B8V62_08465 [Streptococcus agalactiae]OVF13380.1 hypothetical protein B7O91_05675 [Streptococcus agalactiae]OVF13606.1 hypothetical protein B7O92_05145 [Streptococcus agalactiae]